MAYSSRKRVPSKVNSRRPCSSSERLNVFRAALKSKQAFLFFWFHATICDHAGPQFKRREKVDNKEPRKATPKDQQNTNQHKNRTNTKQTKQGISSARQKRKNESCREQTARTESSLCYDHGLLCRETRPQPRDPRAKAEKVEGAFGNPRES